jgi:hypothetical protein
MIVRKTEAELETMARAGKVVAETLDMLEREAKPGVTTADLHRPGRRADVQGLPRLPGVHLRVSERDGRARHPRPLPAV